MKALNAEVMKAKRAKPSTMKDTSASTACELNAVDIFKCPTPNCDFHVWLEDVEEEAELKSCPQCKKSSCVKCGVQPYHAGLTCTKKTRRSRRRL
jgi:hypothetical protein